MRKQRGLRLSDSSMEQLARLQRVTNRAQYDLLEAAIAKLYDEIRSTPPFGAALIALEQADQERGKDEPSPE